MSDLVSANFGPLLREWRLARRLSQQEAAFDPSPGGARELRDQVLAYEGVPLRLRLPGLDEAPPPITIAAHLRFPDGSEARFFTTLTTLGTPLDVTAEEVRIESYFPMDDATEAFVRALAAVA